MISFFIFDNQNNLVQKIIFPNKGFVILLILIFSIPKHTYSQRAISEGSVFVGSTIFNVIEYQNPQIVWDMSPAFQKDLNFAITLLDEKKPEEAIQILNTVNNKEETHWALNYYKGVCYNQLYKFDSAAICFKVSLLLNPYIPDTYLEYGKTLLFSTRKDKSDVKKSFEETKNQFEKALELNPNHTTAILYLAGIELIYNNKNKVNDYLKRIETIEPNNYQVPFIRAIILLESNNNLSKAALLLNQSLTQKPDFVAGLLARISLNEKLKEPEKVLEDVSSLIRLTPNNYFLIYVRGVILTELKKYNEAYLDFKKILTSDIFYLGENFFDGNKSDMDKQIDWQECVEYQIRTISILPENEQEYIKKLICLSSIGKQHEAAATFNSSVQNESVNLSLVKALIYEQLEQHDKAFDLYNLCLTKDNSIYLAYKKRSIYLAELKDFSAAHKDLNKLEKLKPYSAVVHKLRAAFFFSQNNLVESEKSYTKFIEMDSLSFDVYLLRSLIRQKLNMDEPAFHDLHKYLSHHKDFTYFNVYKNLAQNTQNQSKALQFFRQGLLEEGAGGAHYLVFAASLLINLDKADSAEKLIEPIVKNKIDEIWRNHYESDHWYFTTPQNRDPDNPLVLYKGITEEFFYVQSILYLRKKQYKKALELVNLVISYNPEAIEAKYIRVCINLEYQPKDVEKDLVFLNNIKYKNSEQLMQEWTTKKTKN